LIAPGIRRKQEGGHVLALLFAIRRAAGSARPDRPTAVIPANAGIHVATVEAREFPLPRE
jgi:hypothetical protein